jgi:hypothetical protein
MYLPSLNAPVTLIDQQPALGVDLASVEALADQPGNIVSGGAGDGPPTPVGEIRRRVSGAGFGKDDIAAVYGVMRGEPGSGGGETIVGVVAALGGGREIVGDW